MTTNTATTEMAPTVHKFNDETWEVRRERVDAEYSPLLDAKGRKVHDPHDHSIPRS